MKTGDRKMVNVKIVEKKDNIFPVSEEGIDSEYREEIDRRIDELDDELMDLEDKKDTLTDELRDNTEIIDFLEGMDFISSELLSKNNKIQNNLRNANEYKIKLLQSLRAANGELQGDIEELETKIEEKKSDIDELKEYIV